MNLLNPSVESLILECRPSNPSIDASKQAIAPER